MNGETPPSEGNEHLFRKRRIIKRGALHLVVYPDQEPVVRPEYIELISLNPGMGERLRIEHAHLLFHMTIETQNAVHPVLMNQIYDRTRGRNPRFWADGSHFKGEFRVADDSERTLELVDQFSSQLAGIIGGTPRLLWFEHLDTEIDPTSA